MQRRFMRRRIKMTPWVYDPFTAVIQAERQP